MNAEVSCAIAPHYVHLAVAEFSSTRQNPAFRNVPAPSGATDLSRLVSYPANQPDLVKKEHSVSTIANHIHSVSTISNAFTSICIPCP